MKALNQRHPYDVAHILKAYGEQFLAQHRLCPDQMKAFRAILKCRTAAMGGHMDRCGNCDHSRIAYNSCRNRSCNKCQFIKQLVWVDQLKAKLPVCRYFHMVFTIPSTLHKLFYLNQHLCYGLLFKATAETLQKVGANPKFLGAQTGAVAVLHTWGQALTYHPHIHMIIPAGGLSEDGTEWIHSRKNFFLPVKILSRIFRGVLWSMLEKHIQSDTIKLPEDIPSCSALKKLLYQKNWNVYAKKSLAGPQSVLRYLGRYTHRVAISNSRIKAVENGKVTIAWKDYRIDLKNRLLTMESEEFIGRFMRHVLPSGFYKIRYYGILASANTSKKQQCFALINQPVYTSLLAGVSMREVLFIVTGKASDQCPKCKRGKMIPHTILDPV